jgi:hypothetical protein
MTGMGLPLGLVIFDYQFTRRDATEDPTLLVPVMAARPDTTERLQLDLPGCRAGGLDQAE